MLANFGFLVSSFLPKNFFSTKCIFFAFCHIIVQIAIFLFKGEITLQKKISQYKMRATKRVKDLNSSDLKQL